MCGRSLSIRPISHLVSRLSNLGHFLCTSLFRSFLVSSLIGRLDALQQGHAFDVKIDCVEADATESAEGTGAGDEWAV